MALSEKGVVHRYLSATIVLVSDEKNCKVRKHTHNISLLRSNPKRRVVTLKY